MRDNVQSVAKQFRKKLINVKNVCEDLRAQAADIPNSSLDGQISRSSSSNLTRNG